MKSAGDISGCLQRVASIEPGANDAGERGWWATYACQHREFWKIAPPTDTATCNECLAAFGRRLGEKR